MNSHHSVNILVKAKDQTSSVVRNITRSLVGLGAGVVSFYAIKNAVTSSLSAFMEQENALNKLRSALALLNAEMQADELAAFAGQLQKITTYGDETLQVVMALGASMGKLSGQDLKDATIAAIGLAKAFNMDLNTAMTLIAKAALGNTSTMSRYGVVLDENLTAAEKLAAVIALGKSKFALAGAETETFAGKLTQLKNAFGDAQEQIGQMITKIPGLINYMDIYRMALLNYGTVTEIVWTTAKLRIEQVGSYIEHFGYSAGMMLHWLGDNWKNIFQTIWNYTKTVTVNMHSNLMQFFQAVWSWLKGDGFDFTWTGLLEGFESTLTALPDIFERKIGPTELVLQKRLSELYEKLGQEMAPAQLNLGGTASSPAAGGLLAAGTQTGKVAAVEGRFLTGANPAVDYARATASENKQQTGLLRQIARALADSKKMPQLNLVAANFR